MDLLKYVQIPRNWVVEIDVSGVKFAEENGYEAILTVFWLYRFGLCVDQQINVYFKGKLQKTFQNEGEAYSFFQKRYPNSSDFVWKNRDPLPCR